MKSSLLKFFIAASSLAIVGSNSFADEIKIGAGAAPANAIIKPLKSAYEAKGDTLTLYEQGPKLAMQELMKGNIDIAAAGVTFDETIGLVKKEGIAVNPSDFHSVVVGKTVAVAMINKDNPVSTLSEDQLKGIMTGKIKNWKDVGGKDSEILIVFGKLTPGQNSLFAKKIMDGEAYSAEVLDATTGPEVKIAIQSNPEAIGVSAISVADATVKVPKQPEASGDMVFITKGKPNAKSQKFIDFVLGDGKKLVK